jgi:nucleoside-diphosphate-sugar epimerase
VREDDEPRPISAYGITKLGCEQLARAYAGSLGLDCVVLRYFTIYGPRQRPDMAFTRVVEALLQGEPFDVYGDGLQSREFTYVSDAVEANLLALERAPAGAVYNVSCGSEATLREAIEMLERAAGRRLDLRLSPAAAGDVRRTAADTSRIRADLGWAPRVGLEAGLGAELAWAAARVGAR